MRNSLNSLCRSVGDVYDVQFYRYPHWHLDSMPTAIARIYSPEGFVVAADGRACGLSATDILTDNMQKIFSIESDGRSLAYSVAGTETLISDLRKGRPFSFLNEFRKAAEEINPALSRNLYGHCVRICRKIQTVLQQSRASGHVLEYPSELGGRVGEPGNTIVRIFVDGYFRGRPSRAQIRFWHSNQILGSPGITEDTIYVGGLEAHGSTIVGHLLIETDDERFAKYRWDKTVEPTLATAIGVAKNYILACSDPIAREIDSVCRGIGGTPHIATITPREGFRWVPGFRPQADPEHSRSGS